MHLPTIGSQKSEYDYLYRTNTAGTGSIEEVSPLPNAFVHPQPQPLADKLNVVIYTKKRGRKIRSRFKFT